MKPKTRQTSFKVSAMPCESTAALPLSLASSVPDSLSVPSETQPSVLFMLEFSSVGLLVENFNEPTPPVLHLNRHVRRRVEFGLVDDGARSFVLGFVVVWFLQHWRNKNKRSEKRKRKERKAGKEGYHFRVPVREFFAERDNAAFDFDLFLFVVGQRLVGTGVARSSGLGHF